MEAYMLLKCIEIITTQYKDGEIQMPLRLRKNVFQRASLNNHIQKFGKFQSVYINWKILLSRDGFEFSSI